MTNSNIAAAPSKPLTQWTAEEFALHGFAGHVGNVLAAAIAVVFGSWAVSRKPASGWTLSSEGYRGALAELWQRAGFGSKTFDVVKSIDYQAAALDLLQAGCRQCAQNHLVQTLAVEYRQERGTGWNEDSNEIMDACVDAMIDVAIQLGLDTDEIEAALADVDPRGRCL